MTLGGAQDGPTARAAVRAVFDARAATYDASVMHRGVAQEVADLVTSWVGPSARVVDVGTGTGLVLRALPGSLERVGLDLSPRMLEVARRGPVGLRLVRGDAIALPFADATADALTCVTVLHLLPDPVAAMREWGRLLRPDGLAVTATFVEAGAPGPIGGPSRNHAPFCSPAALSSVAEAAGLVVVASHESTHGGDRLLVARLGRRA